MKLLETQIFLKSRNEHRECLTFENMKRALFQLFEYLGFLKQSINAHGIHSPFVYNLYNEVLNTDKEYYFFGPIESLRASYLTNNNTIKKYDLGAGSVLGNSPEQNIARIARTSLQSAKNARLLFRLADFLQPENIIELGTSLGISTCYLGKALTRSKIYTIEGNPELAAVAQQGFKKLGINNIISVNGSFEEHFPKILHQCKNVDFILFDGNHRLEPTLSYFHLALPFKSENSVFVFDDIYWSKEMKEAWENIKSHPEVSISVDLFDMGLVFFKTGASKQHFKIRI